MPFQDALNAFEVYTDQQGNALLTLGRDGLIKVMGGVPAIGNGVPQLVAKFDATAQAANVPPTTIYNVPANGAGMYRVTCYLVLTQAATTSATLPAGTVVWTDADTSVNVAAGAQMGGTSTTNVVGTTNGARTQNVMTAQVVQAAAGTAIQFSTAGYASVGATPMQFAVHVKLEYLGQ